jgi:hypothetical protein
MQERKFLSTASEEQSPGTPTRLIDSMSLDNWNMSLIKIRGISGERVQADVFSAA